MALVPQDLVWVDGRSSSWRNPCEIGELSALVVTSNPSAQKPSGPFQRRIVSAVQLPDHSYAADYEPWPPTLSYHLNSPGSEIFWGDAGSDMPFAHSIHIDYPVVIGKASDDEAAMVTVRLVTEPGYSGRGRRRRPEESVRITPVFERSRDAETAAVRPRNDAARRISIEFISDDDMPA